jgi:uncharacterized protein (DUF1015 family)
MPLIIPFAGLLPQADHAEAVAAPPYDVLSAEEARTMVAGSPASFLHISRAEVDLPAGTDPYSDAVYARARGNLERLRAEGILIQDPSPQYYVYRLEVEGHRQTGLVVAASVEAYRDGRIRRHELTRPAKEQDRVRQIAALDAQTGPVFLVYRAAPQIDARLGALCDEPPVIDITAGDGVRHQLWPVADAEAIAALSADFDALGRLYIADGHHRAAAAARVADERRKAKSAGTSSHGASHGASPDAQAPRPSEHFLAVLFPHDQLRILPYNRVVSDLNGLAPEAFLARIAENYQVEASAKPVAPEARGEVGLYLGGQWHRLQLRVDLIPADDPIGRLDVSLLHDQLIAPLLQITDPRRDERIDFVGGVRGLSGLSARVDSGEMAAAFALPATRMEDLLAVADAGAMMPPKSTWFEPKLADGLVTHLLD